MNAEETAAYFSQLLKETDSDDMKGFIERLPDEIGTFHIMEKRSSQGISYFDWHINFFQDISVEMRGNWGIPSVQFIFFTREGMEWGFLENKNTVCAGKGELCVYKSSDLTSVGTYRGGSDFCCQSVQVPVSLFERLLDSYFNDRERRLLFLLLTGVTTMPITPRMRLILTELGSLSTDTDTAANSAMGLYLEGKLLELLSECLSQMLSGGNSAPHNPDISRTERENLLNIRQRIDSSFSDTLSLEQLAREAGMSVSKLTRGFRDMSGMSVHSYIIDKRLEHAALLLAEGRLNVSQTALACGYSNMSHFSSAFKKKYGVLPREYAG